ncbi:MAG: tRNA (adenosine(37)-N6)-dimethylallyltransferase MiaA [Candidatus Doudnabacteria bacterium]
MSKEKLPKILAIVGPTATGKSDLAVFLAKKFNGEVVSADSRQVYKGMDLGSGKISKKETKGIKHYMLDVASPKSASYNVSKFKKASEKAISNILKAKKLPILCGGTGFWIDAVCKNQNFSDVAPNKKLRDKLSKLSTEKLFAMLLKLDPQRAKNIDAKNKRRVIRALEIIKGSNKSAFRNLDGTPKYQVLYIGLDMDTTKLLKKISKRLDIRLKKGMIAEVKRLHQNGVSWKILENFGLEYRFVSLFLQGKISKEQMRTDLLTAVKKYAKRQRTWFKRNKEIFWFDPNKKSSFQKTALHTKNFLKEEA